MPELIVALDGTDLVKSLEMARKLADQFPEVGFKVNDLLREQGYELINRLRTLAKGPIMADLKLHDIPNTVGNDCLRLRRYEPDIVTVHAAGGIEMITAAVETLGEKTKVFCISVLTSLSPEEIYALFGRNAEDMVTFFVHRALRASAAGLICSPKEVKAVRQEIGHEMFEILTAGVRPIGADCNDQQRVGTVSQAVADGANYLVIGRPITTAPDPVEATRLILHEMEEASARRAVDQIIGEGLTISILRLD